MRLRSFVMMRYCQRLRHGPHMANTDPDYELAVLEGLRKQAFDALGMPYVIINRVMIRLLTNAFLRLPAEIQATYPDLNLVEQMGIDHRVPNAASLADLMVASSLFRDCLFEQGVALVKPDDQVVAPAPVNAQWLQAQGLFAVNNAPLAHHLLNEEGAHACHAPG